MKSHTRQRSGRNCGAREVASPGVEDEDQQAPQLVVLTDRVRKALEALPRSLSGYVFVSPRTGQPWVDVRKQFRAALKGAEVEEHTLFHDLRRSFITNARRWGIDESIVMTMSGHKTRSAFERYNIVSEDDQRRAVREIEAGRQRELEVARKTQQSKGNAGYMGVVE